MDKKELVKFVKWLREERDIVFAVYLEGKRFPVEITDSAEAIVEPYLII